VFLKPQRDVRLDFGRESTKYLNQVVQASPIHLLDVLYFCHNFLGSQWANLFGCLDCSAISCQDFEFPVLVVLLYVRGASLCYIVELDLTTSPSTKWVKRRVESESKIAETSNLLRETSIVDTVCLSLATYGGIGQYRLGVNDIHKTMRSYTLTSHS
jgi:hypothetical protein